MHLLLLLLLVVVKGAFDCSKKKKKKKNTFPGEFQQVCRGFALLFNQFHAGWEINSFQHIQYADTVDTHRHTCNLSGALSLSNITSR